MANKKTPCTPLEQIRGTGWVVSGLCHGLADGNGQENALRASPRGVFGLDKHCLNVV